MEAGKKKSSCSDCSKYGAFILGKSEQKFKIQSPFLIFGTLIVKVNDMMNQHHRLLNVYVNYLEIFGSYNH